MSLSERTKSYVQALIQDGDQFDYRSWLAQARTIEATKKVEQKADAEVQGEASVQCSSQSPSGRVSDDPVEKQAETELKNGAAAKPLDNKGVKQTIRANLKRVSLAWGVSQSSRQRDAIYRYLDRVFVLVKKYRRRGRLSHLISKSQQFAGLPKSKKADVYTTVIRATTHNEIDHRAISKYARALRYCRKKKGEQSLQAFIKNKGGINACAARYSQRK